MAIQNLDLEEQEQLDKLRHFWEKWGTLITTVVVLALLAFAGWRGYQWYESNQAVKASALYDQIQADADAGDTAKLANSLKLMQDDFASTTYGQHAGLLAAQVFLEIGQAEQSRAALGGVAEKGPDKGLQGLARLQLARALVLSGEKTETAPVFLNGLQSAGAGQEYGPQAALGLVRIIPPAILGLAIQRYLVRGLTFGAVKR